MSTSCLILLGNAITNLDVPVSNLAEVVLHFGDALDKVFLTMKASHNAIPFVLALLMESFNHFTLPNVFQ